MRKQLQAEEMPYLEAERCKVNNIFQELKAIQHDRRGEISSKFRAKAGGWGGRGVWAICYATGLYL